MLLTLFRHEVHHCFLLTKDSFLELTEHFFVVVILVTNRKPGIRLIYSLLHLAHLVRNQFEPFHQLSLHLLYLLLEKFSLGNGLDFFLLPSLLDLCRSALVGRIFLWIVAVRGSWFDSRFKRTWNLSFRSEIGTLVGLSLLLLHSSHTLWFNPHFLLMFLSLQLKSFLISNLSFSGSAFTNLLSILGLLHLNPSEVHFSLLFNSDFFLFLILFELKSILLCDLGFSVSSISKTLLLHLVLELLLFYFHLFTLILESL
jgi:hypothetical protein